MDCRTLDKCRNVCVRHTICFTVDAEIFKGILFSRLGLTSKFKGGSP